MDEKKLMIVKTDKGCFISDCFATSGYDFLYYRGSIEALLFNGKKAQPTYYPTWYYIQEYPTLIQVEKCGERINERYELKDKSLISEKIPEVIPCTDKNAFNFDVIGDLYSYKYDNKPPYLEEVGYKVEQVCEIENYNFPPKINYEAIREIGFKNLAYEIKNADVQHQLLDRMIFPEVLLHERPCKFTSEQMYTITRQFVLNNIDQSKAKITSNYDFCFDVKKLIPLIEPKTITYNDIFGKTKRERNKIHTSIKHYEEKRIFAMTDNKRQHQGYPIIPEMCADSEEELKEKVDTWLLGLMEIINKPLCQCPECKGTGYVGDIERPEFIYDK